VTPDCLEEALAGEYHGVVAGAVARHELLLVDSDAHAGRAPAAFDAVDVLWFANVDQAWEHITGDGALAADRELAGVVFGSERLLARPNRVL
jgi:hypothetical protein